MVPDDRSSVGESGFDFNSQSGILGVLASIRASELTPAEKNELRDLVFLYSNGGGDAAVRGMLEERLRTHAIVPIIPLIKTPPRQTEPTVTSGFASGRPSPQFTPSAVVQTLEAVVVPVAPVVPNVLPPVVESSVIPREVSTPTAAPAPIRPVVVPVPVIVPKPDVLTPIVPVAPTIPDLVAKNETSEPQTDGMSVDAVAVATKRLDRIREIKGDINARVGNPVNLVDIDNNLGREYMAALLGAMKLLSTASQQESNLAMARLESVYTLINEVLEVRGAPVVEPVAPHPSTQVEPLRPLVPVSVFAEPRSVPATPVYPVEPKFPPKSAPVVPAAEVSEPWSSTVINSVPQPAVPPIENTEWRKMDLVRPVTVVSPVSMQTPPSVVAGEMPSPTAVTPLVSVAASVAPLRSIQELPTTDDVQNASIVGDPLYTQDVDDGLHQLLSEWSLFKKSGLFGTGPHGRQHPLFLKIAGVQLPLVLAGRFEGSTQDIKQSITDYMNGWRYEQGIVYEQNETFEQYLRRVIRHIIDWQNKRRSS